MFWSPQKKGNKPIAQVAPSMSDHDAISNYMFSVQDLLREEGVESDIYCAHVTPKLKSRVSDAYYINPEDYKAIIYHHSIGDPVVEIVKDFKVPTILYYHNITPPGFFQNYSSRLYEVLSMGLEQLRELAAFCEVGIAASEFSEEELKSAAYKKTGVIPIFFDTKRIESISGEDSQVKEFLAPGEVTNILFIGRVTPNKSHKDLIKAYYLYHKYFNSMSRLNLIGKYSEMRYVDELRMLIKKLDLGNNVHIGGMVNDLAWKTYYKYSDIFVSLSDHEGFFVPALEANYFEIPVVAYNAGAVPTTVGDGGIVLDTKNSAVVAETINKVLEDEKLKKELVALGRENYKKFEKDNFRADWMRILGEYL